MSRVKDDNGLTEAYKFFKTKHSHKIDIYTYKKICYEINKMICDQVLQGKMVSLPHGIGAIWIKKYKMNLDKPKLDLHETKKQGKKIYHLNFNSDGYQVRWCWRKKHNWFKNTKFYSFHPTRDNSRRLAKVMKQEGGHKKFMT